MTLDATSARRVGLPVDGRGELPDATALSVRLHEAVERAAAAGLDVELHVSPGAEVLPGRHADVLAAARAEGAAHGVDVRVVS